MVDVSEVWDQKIKSILAFSSQFYNPESNEKETPISSKSFMDFLGARARNIARPIHAEYGEGFTKARYLGVDSLFDLK